MSERPTDTQPPRAAAAHRHGQDDRRQPIGAGPGGRSVAERAAKFREGAPFLVERATLYDPEPLDPPIIVTTYAAQPPRRVLPVALTLLGVVVVVGLAAGILFVRNAEIARLDGAGGRLEQFSGRAQTPGGAGESPGTQPNATTLAYDLTRRPEGPIIGAWRPAAPPDGPSTDREEPSDATKRRALPRRPSRAAPEAPPEAVTRPVASLPPRHDPPEPKRRIGDGDQAPGSSPTSAADRGAAGPAERGPQSVVARVGRASEPVESEGPKVEIPLDRLALPRRRPNTAAIEEKEVAPAASEETRRKRLLRLQRQVRREQRQVRKREYDQRQWVPEALYGNRFVGMERLLP